MLKIISMILLVYLFTKILNYSYLKSEIILDITLKGKGVSYITPSALNNFSNNEKTVENYESKIDVKKNNKNQFFNIKEELLIVLLFIICLIIGVIGFIFNL